MSDAKDELVAVLCGAAIRTGMQLFTQAASRIESLTAERDEARGMLARNEGRVKEIVDDALLARAKKAEAERDTCRANFTHELNGRIAAEAANVALLDQLQAAERCVEAAVAMRPYADNGYVTPQQEIDVAAFDAALAAHKGKG